MKTVRSKEVLRLIHEYQEIGAKPYYIDGGRDNYNIFDSLLQYNIIQELKQLTKDYE